MNSYLRMMQEVGIIPSIMALGEAADIYRICSKKEDGMTLS